MSIEAGNIAITEMTEQHSRSLYYGAFWSAVNALVSIAGPFVTFIFAARALTPIQFGTIGFAVSMGELLKCLAPQGLYEVLLSKGTNERADRAALSVLILSGFALLIVFEVALLLSGRLHTEIETYILPLSLLGLRSIFDLTALQAQATLARRLDFARLSLRSIVANGVAIVVGLSFIALGAPFWGLVLYYLSLSVVSFLTVVIGTRTLAKPSRDFSALNGLRKEGFFASMVRLLGAVNNYFDQTLVGLLVPPAALGNFAFGKRFEMALVTGGMSFSGILFQPSFASATPEQRESLYTRGLLILTVLFSFPVLVLLIGSKEFTEIVFGPAWVQAAPIAGLLALSGLLRILGSLFGAQLSATRRNRDLLGVSAFSALLGIATVVTLGPWGIFPLAVGLAFKNGLTLVYFAWIASKNHRLMFVRFARILLIPTALGLIVGGLFKETFATGLFAPPVLNFLVEGLITCSVCVVSLLLLNWADFGPLLSSLVKRIRTAK